MKFLFEWFETVYLKSGSSVLVTLLKVFVIVNICSKNFELFSWTETVFHKSGADIHCLQLHDGAILTALLVHTSSTIKP